MPAGINVPLENSLKKTNMLPGNLDLNPNQKPKMGILQPKKYNCR